jgi:hypothetical protein
MLATAMVQNEVLQNPDYCPKWPPWATADGESTPLLSRYKVAVESRYAALYYLGWALHLVQDITVPHNAINYADTDSEDFEKEMKEGIGQGRFDHLPLYAGVYHEDGTTKVYDPHARLPSKPGFKALAMEARMAAIEYSGIEKIDDDEYNLNNPKGLAEKMMDVGIKLTALGLDMFFSELKTQLYEESSPLERAKTVPCGVIMQPVEAGENWRVDTGGVCFELSAAERDKACEWSGAWKACTVSKCRMGPEEATCGPEEELRVHRMTACADYETLICGGCECYEEARFKPEPTFEPSKCAEHWYRLLHQQSCEEWEETLKKVRRLPGPEELIELRDHDAATGEE